MVSIAAPSFILMKLSGPEDLGASGALLVALAFPFAWGLYELLKHRKVNFIALLGLVSVLLTGGIGLLKIDPQWLAIKEAAVPGVIGIAVLISARTRYPLVRTLLYTPAVLNIERIHQKLVENGALTAFEERLVRATHGLSGTFFFSSAMNYILAKSIVTSPAGSQAFNEQLGTLTFLSYPIIAIPSLVMMTGLFYYLWRTIRTLTGLTLEEALAASIQHRS